MGTTENRLAQIEKRIKKVVLNQLPVKDEDLKPTSSFALDLGADSLDSVELVMGIEEEFNIEIPDDHTDKITTIQDATQYVADHLPGET